MTSWEEEVMDDIIVGGGDGDIMGEEMMGDIIMGGGDNGMMVLRRWVGGNSETEGFEEEGGHLTPFLL